MDPEAGLEEAAAELYALPPAEFIAARNEHIKQARAAGDKTLASAIGALRRPTVGAWVVNLLARGRADLVDQLTELGDALRAAQETLSGPELRALSSQRQRVVASVVAEARTLAVASGGSVSDAVERELEATFHAALTDRAAAAAVRSGRLETTLSHAGLGDPAPGAEPTLAPPVTERPPEPPDRTSRQAAEAERKRDEARRAAEEALRDAQRAVDEAVVAQEEAVAAREQAERESDAAQRRVEKRRRRLEQAEREAVEATDQIRETARTATRREQAAEEAERHRDAAREDLTRLEGE